VLIRTTTRLVEVNVLVHDKKGRFIKDLEKEDFIIEDDGKPEQIRVFVLRAPQSSSGRTSVGTPRGVFSNRHAEGAGLQVGVTAILLDGLNTSWGDQANTRQHVLRYLQQIQPQDRIALYSLGRELKVLHDYTRDPKALAETLSEFLNRVSQELAASHSSMIGVLQGMANEAGTAEDAQKAAVQVQDATEAIQGIINTLKEQEYFYKGQRVLTTLKALESIANHLAGVPGRKNLVWVSGSFPLQLGYVEPPDSARGPSPEISGSPYSARYGFGRGRRPRALDPDLSLVKHGRSRTFGKELDRAVRAMNAANLAVYPVDARGLSPNPKAFQNIASMKDLAGKTGGKAYYSTNDIKNSIREAVEDAQLSYTLAYYPSEQKLDGRFRRIKVKVKRPGLVVRHRRGYYDVAEVPSDVEAVMWDAAWSPLDATGVALEARLAPADKAEPNALLLQLNVNLDSITLEPRRDGWKGTLDVLLLQTDGQGNGYKRRSQIVVLQVPPATYETILKQGYVYSEKLQRAEEATELRVVIRDAPSGKIGRVRIPFSEIPRSIP
jgi:VWFA-related protein